MVEEWRSVVGYEGRYDVSDLGRVRSLTRWVERSNGGYLLTGRVLKPSLSGDGYPMVALGSEYNRKVHTLVAAAFIGPRPTSSHHILHGNHNKRDNCRSNLSYGTRQENINQDYDDATGRRARVVLVRRRDGATVRYRSITDVARVLRRHKLTIKKYACLGVEDPYTGMRYEIQPLNFEVRLA